MLRRRLAAALLVACAAFALYRSTLLPGVDLGDTGSFHATAGEPVITPRDGYPLYFAIGDLFVWFSRAEPAHALNLASAVEGAIAAGLLVLAAAKLAGSLAAGVAAALMFAGSYTFWSQAIIAEVYALHAVFVSGTLLLLLRYADRPTLARLAAFFAIYALGFGNHLSMVLLLPGYTLFLFLTAPRGWRTMISPRVLALAGGLAAAGALQYLWNLRAFWMTTAPPSSLADALQMFWFDVTKSDWRETMVMQVPGAMVRDHLSMYWFDLRQQFGLVAPVLSLLGAVRLFQTSWRRGVLVVVLYAVNAAFAFSYNVGDTHVFYLPSHLVLAMLMAPGLVWLGILTARVLRSPRALEVATTAAAALLAAAGLGQAYDNYPALDRSDDRRPAQLLASLTDGLDDRHAILLTDLSWQIQNGLSYFGKETRPELAWTRALDVMPYLPALVRDNVASGRDVVLTEHARLEVARKYGPLLSIARDDRVATVTLADLARGLPPGTRYVLAALKPTRDLALDVGDLREALRTLGAAPDFPAGDYAVVAGSVGRMPALVFGSSTPFRRRVMLDGTTVDVRMEAWLSADTIRRMGFGHVIAGRRHTMILERGANFVAFDATGRALRAAYAASLFAPQPRYLVRTR